MGHGYVEKLSLRDSLTNILKGGLPKGDEMDSFLQSEDYELLLDKLLVTITTWMAALTW